MPGTVVYVGSDTNPDFHRITIQTEINGEIYYIEYLHADEIEVSKGQTVQMGTLVASGGGGWGTNGPNDYRPHLDFRMYKFKDDKNTAYSSDSEKTFYDPFEFFDIDIQINYCLDNNIDDYH